ncbi:unnamed protein product, partial [Iphiclides podalirius]
MEDVKSALKNMSEKFTAQMARFEARQESNTPLAAEFQEFKSFVLTALSTLHCQIEMVVQDVEQQEIRSRRKMLLLHGLQEVKGENLEVAVVKLAKDKLSVSVEMTYTISGIVYLWPHERALVSLAAGPEIQHRVVTMAELELIPDSVSPRDEPGTTSK